MPADIPYNDPTEKLLLRASPDDLEKFWDLMDQIPVPVGEIAERLGIEVFSTTLDPNISGLIKRTAPSKYEIQVNDTDAPVRQRFTVCHEISHFLLHRTFIDAVGITDNILYRSQLSNAQESEANRLGKLSGFGMRKNSDSQWIGRTSKKSQNDSAPQIWLLAIGLAFDDSFF